MATFLSLCQDVARESGTISGSQPSTVSGQTGRLLKIVNYVIDAWKEIQKSRRDWSWMNREWTGSTIASTQAYTAASFSISNLSRWLPSSALFCYLTADGKSTEYKLEYIEDWKFFRECYLKGSTDAAMPVKWAIRPYDNAIVLYPTPDDVYTLTGEYKKTVQTLAADDDIPELNADFHDIIKWRALQLLSEHDEALQAASMAAAKYGPLYRDLVNLYTPKIQHGAAVA